MLRPLRSELFRLRKRWIPWIMLALIVVAAFVFYFLIWVTVRAQLEAVRAGQIVAGRCAALLQGRAPLVPTI